MTIRRRCAPLGQLVRDAGGVPAVLGPLDRTRQLEEVARFVIGLAFAGVDPRGQAHSPGYYWSATSGGHVIYESRRRHVPDFLLVHADQTVQVVNVKPAARLADPAVAEGPGLAGRAVRGHSA